METPPPARARWRLVLSYDGAAFRGFADQPGQVTVAGTLAQALARTVRLAEPPRLTCAGRTDAGVHARHQVVHVDLPDPLPPTRTPGAGGGAEPMSPTDLRRALNRQLAPAVVVRSAGPAPADFDARHDARARRYRYLVWNAPVPDPLLAPMAWHVADRLDLRHMMAGADALIGEHDFRAFCRRAPGTPPTAPLVRRVRRADWHDDRGDEAADAGGPVEGGVPVTEGPEEVRSGRLLRFDVEADSFCHQMVRSMVGLLVEVGRGRATPARVVELLRSADRSGAPDPAPAHGLCLVGVDYGRA